MVNDKYVVKYLDPRTGKYEYATIKDVGDLQKLNTKVKTSIVDAINSISTDGIGGLRDDLNAIGETIKSLEDGTLELGDFQSIDDVVSREIEDAINSLKLENSGLLQLTQEEINKIVSNAESEYRDNIATSIRELETSKTDLVAAREKMITIGKMLENANIDYSNLTQVVDNINLYITDIIEKTDFDMVNGIVSDYKTAVTQTQDGWGVDASKNMLSYLTGRVKSNETSLNVQHGLIEAKVGKDEFQYMTVDNLPAGKENMLHNTFDLRDWGFSSAFIFKSADDYRFTSIVQADSAGENITGTTDELEQGVTYAISTYVNVQNKNKEPGQEKYAPTDGLYTATVIIDGDTIELNNVVEDNSALDGWKRVSGTFIAKRTAKQDIKFYVTAFNRDTQVGYLSAPKFEKGSSATSWVPHIEDNVSTMLSQNAVMRVLSDRITSSVEEVRETKDAFETATSTFDQMADGFELNTNKLTEVLDKYGEVTGVQTQQASELKVLNESITSKVWKQDINTTIDTINIDTSNRIVNSAFNIYSYDEQTGELKLDYWNNNTGFAIKKHSQSLDNYLYAKRSNATSVNPISIKSSPFALRDGEKTLFNFEYLAVGNPLDDDNVFTLEMYDNNDVRVGLQEFRLSELKKEFLTAYDVGDSYKYNGSYIVKNSSVVKGTITLKLPKNGELWLTKIMFQNAGIGTIGWTPSSVDNQIIQSKLSTEINQLADSIELVATDERLDAINGLLVKKDGKVVISPEAIISRVTSQELGEKGLITQTSLKQTEDNLRFDLVDKDGIIQTINASAEGLLIDFDKVQIDGELIARMISAQSIDATQGFRLTDNNGNTLLSVVNDNGKPTLSIAKDFRVKFGEINDKLDVTIVGVVEEYYYSVDPDEPLGGRWTSTPNAFQGGDNRFIWKRTKIIYQSGDTSYYPNETGINITGSWEYEKESVTAEVVRALDSAEDAKELAVSEANQAMIDANKYADEQDALIKQQVETSVSDAISSADQAKQIATDSYNNAVSKAEELAEAQSEAFNKKFEENESEMDTLSQATQDADAKAQDALEKAGANSSLLETHQESLNTISEVTIPNINISISNVMSEAEAALSSAGAAMDEAKKTDGKIATFKESIEGTISDVNETAQSALTEANKTDGKIATLKESISKDVKSASDTASTALSKANTIDTKISNVNTTITDLDTKLSNSISTTSQTLTNQISTASSKAQQALDEANKADGKIADYVTRNGLVSGTTVDTKINDATGEISKKITTVEGKIDGLQVGGRNLFRNSNFADELNFWMHNGEVTRVKVDKNDAILLTGTNYGFFQTPTQLEDDEVYTISFKAKSVGDSSQVRFGFFNQPYGNSTSTSISNTWKTYSFTTNGKFDTSSNTFVHLYAARDTAEGVYITDLKVEKGSIPTDWSPAPEDNLSQSEFQIFENTYSEDVKGINSTLTDLSTKKLDGTTYTDFYENDYKRTAKSASDAFTAVNKIVSDDGTVKDVFSKAVYDQNASRRSSDFNEVTKDLVKTATYESGIDGVKEIITSVEGKVDELQIGGRNLIKRSDFYNIVESGVSGFAVLAEDYQNGLKATGGNNGRNNYIEFPNVLSGNGWYTVSFLARGTQNGTRGLSVVIGDSPALTDGRISNTSNEYTYHTYSYKVENYNSETNNSIKIAELDYAYYRIDNIKLEKGNKATDWSPAPEDNLSDADFRTFESEYSRNSKEITERLSTVENSKLDGETYTDFYENSYKKTAKDATDAYTAVNRIVDSDGNSTENFAKAVYERNAQRQKADFESATEGLLKTATYEEGIDGIKNSLSEVEGKIPTSVGGRNYLLNTHGEYINDNSTTSIKLWDIADVEELRGQVVTFSFELKSSDENNRFYASVSRSSPATVHKIMDEQTSPTDYKKYEMTFSFPTDETGSTMMIVSRYSNYPNNTGLTTFRKLKLEKGNIATDWTPAPEDNLSQEEFKSFQADYEQNAQGITSRLSSAENSITTNNQAFTTFKENEYKRTAERVSDTFTKSETTTMLGSKADASQLTNYLAKSTYERDAEQSKERFETIESDLDNISVGGRNLIKNSAFNSGTTHWSINGVASVQTIDGKQVMLLTDTKGFYTRPVNLVSGSIYTFSYLAKSVGTTANVYFGFLNEVSGRSTTHTVTNEWKRYTYTITTPILSETQFIHFYGGANIGSGLYITDIKLEKGTIATDWTPAPEDMANLSYVDSEITKSANAITTTLQNYAKTTDLNGLATETYATNKAVSEAGKVKNELTKYAKTTDLTGLASETYATNVAVSEAGKVSSELTKYAKTTALTGLATETYAQTQATTEAGKVEQKLTGYAKTTDLNGLATETYATNKAVAEAGKVKSELTKYELKTGVDSKISTASSALRTETAEKLKTVYTKSETNTLLGKKADSSSLNNYVQTATYESGIDGVSQSLTRVEGKVDGLQIGGTNYAFNTGSILSDTSKNVRVRTEVNFEALKGVEGQEITYSFEAKSTVAGAGSVYILDLANYQALGWHVDHKDIGTIGTNWKKFEITAKVNSNITLDSKSEFTLAHNTSSSHTVQVRNLKIEKGNVATDWTPAPEDMQSVAGLDENITAIYNNTSSETSKAINKTLSAYTKSTDFNSKTQTYLTNNQYQTASQIATTLGAYTKTTSLDGTVASYLNNSTSSTASAINTKLTAYQTTTGLDSSVSSLLSNTNSQTAKGFNSKLTAIEGKIPTQIGGRNYLLNTENEKSLTGFGVGWKLSDNKLDLNNREVTVTFYAKHEAGSSPVRLHTYYRTTGGSNLGFSYADKNTTTEWQFFTITIDKDKIPSDLTSYNEVWIRKDDNSNNIKIRNMMLTLGKVALDWTPAPEDMATAVKTNEIESTANGNKTTISNIKTKPGEQIAGYQTIKERSDLYERVIGKDENGVKGNISRIVQTSGIIQSEVASAVPNPNLLSGTDFTEGLGDVGVYSRTPTLSEASYFPYGKVATINTPETSGTANLGFTVRIPKKDTWYTLSFYGLANWVGSKGVSFYCGYMKDSKNYKAPMIAGSSPLRHKIQITVQVTQDDALLYVRPQGNAFGAYSNLVFYGVKLELGEIATPWENSDPASSSKITQLADNINLKVSKDDISNQININTQGVVIGGNKISLSGQTSVNGDFWAKQVNAIKVKADKIEGTTAQFNSLRSSMLTANTITSGMIKAETGLVKKIFSTEAYIKELTSQSLFASQIKAITIDASKITSGTINTGRLNSGAIVTAGLTANVVKSTHIESSNGLIDKIFANEAYIKRMTGKKAFISSIQAININASKITSGTLDASKVTVNNLSASRILSGTLDASKVTVKNLDAANITSNQANLVKAGLKGSSGGTLELSGDQFLSTAKDGSQTYIQNGIVGTRNPDGATIGQIGYVFDGGSPTYTIRTTWGSHFGLKQVFYDSYVKGTKEKRVMYASTGNDGYTTMQFYVNSFILNGSKSLRFGDSHYINGSGSDLTITGQSSVTLRANESTVFVISNNGKNNFASLHANLNMQGNKVTNTSDIRLKRDIVNDEIDSLSALMKWQHAGFNYINPDMNQERQYGVIAQSAPDLSLVGEDGYLQVSLNKQVNMTSHAVQQLGYKVIENDNRVNDKIKELENKIEMLELELKRARG